MKNFVGEMDAEDLQLTCMQSKNQRLVQITTKDAEKAFERLALWHSSKDKYREDRRIFMLNYVPDLKELST